MGGGGLHFNYGTYREARPQHGAGVDALDPQVEHEDQGEDGNALVIIRPTHAPGDVGRHDGCEGCGQQACGRPSSHLLKTEQQRRMIRKRTKNMAFKGLHRRSI